MNHEIIDKLTAKNNSACDFAGAIISESRESNKWYQFFDEFISLLDHPNSFVRNRIIYILAANARWDVGNKFEKILDTYVSHIVDEKPITARQCVKALVEIGESKPALITEIIRALDNADLSKYKDSMRPLIENDIKETKERLTKLILDYK